MKFEIHNAPMAGAPYLRITPSGKRAPLLIINYYAGNPILIKHRPDPNNYAVKIVRVASDRASALVLRQLRYLLGEGFPKIPQLSPADMQSKALELITEQLANQIDGLIEGKDNV